MLFLAAIRLIVAGVLLTVASLAVVPAPTYFLWKVAIGVTEWGHALAGLCCVALALVGGRSKQAKVAMSMCACAAALAVTPIMRAMIVARALPDQCRSAFGIAVNESPIVPMDLFRGMEAPEVPSSRLVYVSRDDALVMDFYPAQPTARPRHFRGSSSPPATVRETASGRAPLVLVIHGGSWRGGSNTDFVAMDRYLAGQGFAVADILYRLAPEWPYPAASDDVVSALAFVRSRADSLNVDPDRIVLLGRSAGGQIALDVAYASTDPGIVGVIAFYAPTDLRWSWDHPGNPLVIDTRGILTDYLGGGPDAFGSAYLAASPVHQVTGQAPPTLLFHGGRDELVSGHHSEDLDRRLGELGVPHLFVSLPWATHGFDYVTGGPGGQLARYAITSFLRSVESGSATK